MSSGLRLRRPVFFAAGLRCPVCLRRIALCPVFLPVFRLSLAGPHLPLPVSLSARISPALSVRPPSSVFRLVFLLSFLVFPFIVHRPPLVIRRPLSIPCRLLSIARCAVHRSSPAACCPSPVVHPLPPVVCCPSSIVHPLPPAVYRPLRRPYPVAFICTPSPAAPHLFPLPFGPDHGFCIRGIPACVSAGAACRVVPQRVPSVGLSAKMRPPSVSWSPRRF